MINSLLVILLLAIQGAAAAPTDGVTFHSPDLKLNETFDWAKKTALGYAHDGRDPVGYWYEAALPGREAFCMRDVAHQSLGGEILGLSRHNFNMVSKFAVNISESKDWCSYWEINRQDKPAPVDYLDDEQFWYNLTANPDVIQACWRLYEWTGNTEYLNNPVLNNFYEKSLTVYLDRWMLNPGQLMYRPCFLNTDLPFREDRKFNRVRGIPSYVESFDDFSCAGDLIAALQAGCRAFGEMLALRGENEKARIFFDKATAYKSLINEKWWNEQENRFEMFWSPLGKFLRDDNEGETYIVWFNAASTPARAKAVLDRVLARKMNVENLSHLPSLLYRSRLPDEAYEYLLSLKGAKRSEYPEVSFGAMEGIVAGLMGVRPSASKEIVQTLPQLTPATDWAEVAALPVLNATVTIRHDGATKTAFTNGGAGILKWRASFYGAYKTLRIGARDLPAQTAADEMGNLYSFVDVEAAPRKTITASVY